MKKIIIGKYLKIAKTGRAFREMCQISRFQHFTIQLRVKCKQPSLQSWTKLRHTILHIFYYGKLAQKHVCHNVVISHRHILQ